MPLSPGEAEGEEVSLSGTASPVISSFQAWAMAESPLRTPSRIFRACASVILAMRADNGGAVLTRSANNDNITMVGISVSISADRYHLLEKMKDEWRLNTVSSTLARFMDLGWAHWSGCLGEKDESG